MSLTSSRAILSSLAEHYFSLARTNSSKVQEAATGMTAIPPGADRYPEQLAIGKRLRAFCAKADDAMAKQIVGHFIDDTLTLDSIPDPDAQPAIDSDDANSLPADDQN